MRGCLDYLTTKFLGYLNTSKLNGLHHEDFAVLVDSELKSLVRLPVNEMLLSNQEEDIN